MLSNLKQKIRKVPGSSVLINIYKNNKIRKIYNNDAFFFKKNYCYSDTTRNTLDYRLMLEIHCLEKGMSVPNPRIFGINHLKEIIRLLNLYDENSFDASFTYNLGFSILEQYKLFFEEKKWKDTENYEIVSEFLHGKKFKYIDCGTMDININEISKYYNIDYHNFMKYRKSSRIFKKKKIDEKDINDVIEILRLTPTACNRQMCKLYMVEESKKKAFLSKNINGLTCFDKDTLTYFVITYDQNAFFSIKERNQGFFNAGLFTMNFVNAMHSKGIGTCILQGDNLPNDESRIKKELGIPNNEKIAVYVVGGYYENNFTVPISPRKVKKDIFIIK